MWYEYLVNKKEVLENASKKLNELPKELKDFKIEDIYVSSLDNYCSLSFFLPTTEQNSDYKFANVFSKRVGFFMENIELYKFKKLKTVNSDLIDIEIHRAKDGKYIGGEYIKVKIEGAINLELVCENIKMYI